MASKYPPHEGTIMAMMGLPIRASVAHSLAGIHQCNHHSNTHKSTWIACSAGGTHSKSRGSSTRITSSRNVSVGVGRRTLIGGLAPCCCTGNNCCHRRNSWYDSYFAFNMAHGMQEYEDAVAPLKQQLFQQFFQYAHAAKTAGKADSSISGKSLHAAADTLTVLEVGIGTGPNFAYYPHQEQQQQQDIMVKVVGLEPNSAMWPYTRASAAAGGLQQQQLQLLAGSAEQLPLEALSCDGAVITLVLCSVADPAQALSEVCRVLRPGAPVLLIEHVIAPQLDFLQLQQRLLDPLQRLLADNCHLTRDTASLIQSAPGWQPQPLELQFPPTDVGVSNLRNAAVSAQRQSGVQGTGLFRFEVEGMGLISPHVAGILTKL